ncbi:YdcF family protein [Zavarzinia sp. CC-PAN008]|uniref:YdcF family protein n=1 Tax=Zavarzinia sp. CC-PAN008 TaxID=3243332 RepID=UPI003F745EC2
MSGSRGVRTISLLIRLVVASILVWAGGFLVFLATLPPSGTAADRADGIVVLTGGPGRLDAALDLLGQGRGTRLLISGVNPETTMADIQRTTRGAARLFACCVDLDHAARDTIGNARETARWARERGYRSVLVVTGVGHMKRSLVELGQVMPAVTLVPHAVVGREGDLMALATEFDKYLAVLMRRALQAT